MTNHVAGISISVSQIKKKKNKKPMDMESLNDLLLVTQPASCRSGSNLGLSESKARFVNYLAILTNALV